MSRKARFILAMVLGLTISLMLFPGQAVQAAGTVFYVDDDNCPVPGNGTQASPFCSIQSGINAASSGDTVQVAAGTYNENISMKSAVVIQGAGQGVSIIDGGGSGSVVTAIGIDSAATLDGFTITNGAASFGAGMHNESSSATVTNCTFSGNTADYGGGMYNVNASSPTVTNCTFTENLASGTGGGMFNTSVSSPIVTNSILWGDSPDEIFNNNDPNSTPSITYSDIQGSYTGTGNINANPLFADGANGDLHLQPTSPCIDTGTSSGAPATDLEGNPRPQDAGYDIGAYEGAYESFSYLYYPHVHTNPPWATEVAIINTGPQTLTGTLRAYGNNGQLVESMAINLNALGRREIDVSAEFADPNAIGYLVLEADSAAVRGYTKFYVAGTYRVAVPAVQGVNTGDVYVSHIDSSQDWWTGVSVVNTTGAEKTITFEFDDGQSKDVTLAAGEHQAFTVAGLFAGVMQPTIHSAVITNASGIVGLELFGTIGANQLSGILLKDTTTSSIYYPHVDSSAEWWTGIVAYNPGATETSIAITPYSAAGVELSGHLLDIPAKGKYIGVVSGLDLPAETAWLELTAASPITGFELFGTTNGNQLAGYTGVGISRTSGVFPKVEKDGWTGIAFVNIGSSAASITLNAYDDDGAVVASEVLDVTAYAKVVDLAENLFSQDISAATCISFSSDQEVVGFQLNGSSDGMMLDGLPGM